MRFWFHYNKPESRRAGTPKLSIHFENVCHVVDGIICDKPVWSRTRPNRQSHIVMVGDAKHIRIEKGTAWIQ